MFLLYRTSPTFHGKEVTSFELFIKNVFSRNTNVWGKIRGDEQVCPLKLEALIFQQLF
jgi:hypothetical protein